MLVAAVLSHSHSCVCALQDWSFFIKKESDGDDDYTTKADIQWYSSDHALLGQVLFRPASSPLVSPGFVPDPGAKCQWYKCVSFTPSVQEAVVASDDAPKQQDSTFEPNPMEIDSP